MKNFKKVLSIISLVVSIGLVPTNLSSPSAKANTVQETVTTAENTAQKSVTTAENTSNSCIAVALHSGTLYNLNFYPHNKRKEIIKHPTKLAWPNKGDREYLDIDLIFFSSNSEKVTEIILLDSECNYVSNLSYISKNDGVTHCHFKMYKELSACTHTKPDDENCILTADFYFKVVFADGSLSYTSLRYGRD